MPYMVIFRSAEGQPGYHQSENLDDAVRFVERLRNQESVEDARVFRMEEVALEFRTYVKVGVMGTPAPAAEPVVDDVPLPDDPVVVEPMPVGSSQGAGRFNRFNR